MRPDQKSLIEKVRKLLALAGNNPSREEAQAAAIKAQAMLAEHGLSISQVETSGKRDVWQYDAVIGPRTWWHAHLARIVARNFRCELVRVRTAADKPLCAARFIGLEDEVLVAGEIYENLQRAAARDAKAFAATSRRQRNTYIYAWLQGLEEALRRGVETCTALALTIPAEVQEAKASLNLEKAKRSRARGDGSAAARWRGFQDGLRASPRTGQLPGEAS